MQGRRGTNAAELWCANSAGATRRRAVASCACSTCLYKLHHLSDVGGWCCEADNEDEVEFEAHADTWCGLFNGVCVSERGGRGQAAV